MTKETIESMPDCGELSHLGQVCHGIHWHSVIDSVERYWYVSGVSRKEYEAARSRRRWAEIKADPEKHLAWNASLKRHREARGQAEKAKTRDKMRALRAANPEQYRATCRKSLAKTRQERPWLALWRAAKNRARERGLEFGLTPEDLLIPEKCPVLGIPLKAGVRRHEPGSPTVDRINNSLGYTKANICVISRRANVLKSDATLEEIDRIAAYMRDRS